MAQEKVSLSARMGTVMGVEKKLPKKERLEVNPQAQSWDQLSWRERKALLGDAKKATWVNKKKLS